jgi:hypothetical protein
MIEERLLVRLRERANAHGTVSVRGEVLIQEAESTTEEVSAALAKLERTGLLSVLAPLPFLVVKLRSWSGKDAERGTTRPAAYSYSQLSPKRVIESYRPAGGDALMREILDTLGETDPTSFEGAIKNFSPGLIRKALDRVRRARSLRKNRTALFRFLLTKLS